MVRSICSLFSASEAIAVGRIIAVVGAKGGVGASTVAHNVAWAIARDLALDSVVIDLDLAFGTASLDYNQDPVQGIANAVFSPDRPDTALMERLLAKCTDHLSLLAAPATLDRVYDFGADAFDAIFDTLRMTTPCIVLDVPHQWSAWTKRTLVGADDILIVAEPDLANLRNTKNMLNMLKAARPNDRPPLYCLNQVGMPKRPEIEASGFAKTIESQPIATIPFDSRMFGTAANNGQMIAEISANHRTTKMFLQIAQRLTGRARSRSRRARSWRRSSGSCGQAAPRIGAASPKRSTLPSSGRQSEVAAATAADFVRLRAALPSCAKALQIGDIGRGLLGRQIGLHDVFGLGHAALQPSTSARLARTRASAARAVLARRNVSSALGRSFDST